MARVGGVGRAGQPPWLGMALGIPVPSRPLAGAAGRTLLPQRLALPVEAGQAAPHPILARRGGNWLCRSGFDGAMLGTNRRSTPSVGPTPALDLRSHRLARMGIPGDPVARLAGAGAGLETGVARPIAPSEGIPSKNSPWDSWRQEQSAGGGTAALTRSGRLQRRAAIQQRHDLPPSPFALAVGRGGGRCCRDNRRHNVLAQAASLQTTAKPDPSFASSCCGGSSRSSGSFGSSSRPSSGGSSSRHSSGGSSRRC
jgi:hypothetical protein